MQLNCKTQEEIQMIVKGAFFLIFPILTGTLNFILYIKAAMGYRLKAQVLKTNEIQKYECFHHLQSEAFKK